MSDTIAAYVARYELDRFVGLEVRKQLTLRRFVGGEALCAIEQPITSLLFLVEGRVKVCLPTANGRQLLLCFYEPPQLFGDLELFEGEPIATTTVAAITPCVCLAVHRSLVLDQLAHDPLFLQQLCRSLSRKLQRVISNSALNLLHPLEQRVASYILATATESDANQLVFGGNLTEIAELLGTSFRHLHRTLQGLCVQGLLHKQGTRYTVEQPIALQRRAAGVYVMP